MIQIYEKNLKRKVTAEELSVLSLVGKPIYLQCICLFLCGKWTHVVSSKEKSLFEAFFFRGRDPKFLSGTNLRGEIDMQT